MALLIFPVGLLAGWILQAPRWAATVTAVIGVATLVVLWFLSLSGAMISPLETLVLVAGTPLSATLAYRIARWRGERRAIRRVDPM